ncbi:hypothetical protein Tco_0377996 [Tanacetum coccineum]
MLSRLKLKAKTATMAIMEMVEMEMVEIEMVEIEMVEIKIVEMEIQMRLIEMLGLLTRWFEKMETMFHISNCLEKYQVKYATCTLLNSALTWWNSPKRTVGSDAMVPEEEDRVENFIGGLPDNIQGNVTAVEPTRLQDAVRIANNLMDQKLKGVQRIENKAKTAANVSTHTPEPSIHFNFTCDDDEEYSIPLKDMLKISPYIALAPVSSIMEPEDSLIMGNEELSTIPEKESDEFIKSRKNLTFSNPLFDSNDDFTSSDDESLSDENVLEENVKIYSNPLFEFDDEYISSDVNPLFDEVLEDIECEDSYDSNLDESTFLVTPLSDSNEDECLAPRDDIELFLHHLRPNVVSLEGFIDEPPLEENDDLFDLESKENDWKKILYDAPIDDLITEDKVFDPGIHEKSFSPTFVKLTFEDRHYLPITFVIRIFLPYLTYSVDSPFLLSSGSEDTIFDPDISTFHFLL